MSKKRIIIINPEDLGEFDPNIEDIQQLEKLPQEYLSKREKTSIKNFNRDYYEELQERKRVKWLNTI